MESNILQIFLWNNFVVIENIRTKKRVSIEKDTLKIKQDFPSLNESMKESKVFPTKGILGIIKFDNQYCLLYILQNKLIGKLNNSEIYQIKKVSSIPLSAIVTITENLTGILSKFSSMMEKGFFYYSHSYDLTNTYLSQRNYLYYKTCKLGYLWNDNLLDRFNKAHIEIEQFFVFAICGFVQCYYNNSCGKGIQCALISRKKHFNFQANNTQLETIIIYGNISVFSYIIKSFCYKNDLNRNREDILEQFQQEYSQYNSIKRSAKSQTIAYHHISREKGTNNSNIIIHILEKNPSIDHCLNLKLKLEEMVGIIIETFDKQQYIQINYNQNQHQSCFQAFVSGIKNLILNSEYTLISKNSQNNLLGFDIDEAFHKKRSLLQKTYAIVISYDEKPIIEFQKHLLWEVFKGYFSQYQLSPLPFMNDIKNTRPNIKQTNGIFPTIAQKKDVFLGSGAKFQNVCMENFEDAFKHYIEQISSQENQNDHLAMEFFFIKSNEFHKNSLSSKSSLNIFILTWNVGAITDLNDVNWIELFFPKNYQEVININYPHIYSIALQEIVKLSTKKVLFQSNGEMVALWIEKLKSFLLGYTFLKHVSLVGLLLIVFVKDNYLNKITYINEQVIKTGFFGTLGNKGSCCVTLSYQEKKISFAAVHLASGNEHNEDRIKDLKCIVKSAPNKNSQKFKDNDHWFVFGDFNFRLNIDSSNILMLLEAKYLENLKSNDQLISNKNKFDFDYMEEEIKFKPTYKFCIGSNKYSSKQTPSWCDRIIYKRSSNIKPLIYDKCELRLSDHKPVIGLFEIFV